MKINIVNHPLIKHHLAILKNKDTSCASFRKAMHTLVSLLAYDVFKGTHLKELSITTPLGVSTSGFKIDEKILICVVLRAGLAMLPPVLDLLPNVPVVHIGMERKEGDGVYAYTKHEVYYKPNNLDIVKGATVYILDPMLATGVSMNLSLSYLKSLGAKRLFSVGIMGAPEGVNNVLDKHPDVQIYLASLEDRLNKSNFIVPGLGDAGDRYFGTR